MMATFGRRWVQERRKMAYAPTTLTALAGLVPPSLDARITIIDEGIEEVNPERLDADLVGISLITPNAPRAYEMADRIRDRGIPVVLGGIHPTLLPEEAGEHADAIVRGYADESWPRLLLDFAGGHMVREYQGCLDHGFQPPGSFPAHHLLKRGRYLLPHSLEATRGCQNNCHFCVIPALSGRRLLTRRVEDVVEEIRTMGARRVTFLDQNPTEDKDYCLSLYESLTPLKIRWSSSITMKLAEDDEWLQAAARSGCRGVLIGFETLEQDNLRREGKPFNQVTRYREFVRRLHRHGIMIFGSFILGLDGDEPDVFDRTLRFLDEAAIDIVKPGIFTPFPGTPDFHRLEAEGRILTRDWSRYDATQVVFQPARMTARQLQEGFYRVYREAHSIRSIAVRLARSRASPLLSLSANVAFHLFGKVAYPHDRAE